jgi:signal transduction histidine kinase
LEFEIPPTFLQSLWFKLICLALGLVALWSVYAMRMRQVAARVRLGLEERLSERDRIARELHDTLLQGFQGLVLNFEAATAAIPPEQPARKVMRAALDRADGVLIEARDRVLDLRSTGQSQDLSQLLTFSAEKMSLEPRIALRVVVEGTNRELHPVVLDEVFRIADEALFNVIQHSEASRVDVSITYHPRELRVHIRDDGRGIDADVLACGRLGHFGLSAMRERAARIQAELAVSSRVGAGTEVGLVVPANAAYVKSRRSERGVFSSRRRIREA